MRKEDPSFLESIRFLPIMLGEGGSYFGNDDLLFPLCNCLPDRTAAKRDFLLCFEVTGVSSWNNLHL